MCEHPIFVKTLDQTLDQTLGQTLGQTLDHGVVHDFAQEPGAGLGYFTNLTSTLGSRILTSACVSSG